MRVAKLIGLFFGCLVVAVMLLMMVAILAGILMPAD